AGTVRLCVMPWHETTRCPAVRSVTQPVATGAGAGEPRVPGAASTMEPSSGDPSSEASVSSDPEPGDTSVPGAGDGLSPPFVTPASEPRVTTTGAATPEALPQATAASVSSGNRRHAPRTAKVETSALCPSTPLPDPSRLSPQGRAGYESRGEAATPSPFLASMGADAPGGGRSAVPTRQAGAVTSKRMPWSTRFVS